MLTAVRIDLALPLSGTVDTRAVAAEAERSGYLGIWVPEASHDPFIALALAATVTERLELGTAIALAFARNPMLMAAQANDVQLISKGRLQLGLGSQIKPHITKRYSMPWSAPAPRMREFVLAMRAIWDCWNSGTRLDFRGDFYTHTLMPPLLVPQPNPYGAPRVLLAGVGEVMTRVAGEVSDGFLVHGFTTEDYLDTVTLPALERGRSSAGLDLAGFDVIGSPLVATGATEEAMADARRGVKKQLGFYGSTPAYRPVLEAHGWGAVGEELHALSLQGKWDEMGEVIDDEVLETFAVVAEPSAVAAELMRRFDTRFTGMTLYTPYSLDPAIALQLVADLRAAGAV